MPGAVAAGFHEGSRSEILADYLFSAWGVVTPVRRSDDYGVDLYCALTERVEQLARVREYFGVQVKSTNDPWTLTGAEVKWLVEYPTPLFLCVVNKKKWMVRVYHLLPRFQAWVLGQLPDVLELIPGEGTEGNFLGWTEGSSFSLSAPIIEAGLDDLNDPGRMDELKQVFACWVEMDRDNCDLVRQGLLRFRRPEQYRVNEKPSVNTELGFTRPDRNLLNRGLLQLVQAVECIGGQLAHGGDLDAGLKAALLIDRIQTNYPEAFEDNRWWQHRVPGTLMQMVVFPLNEALGHARYVYSGLDAANNALIKHPMVRRYLDQGSVSEGEVVLAFLRAEIGSSTRHQDYVLALQVLRLDRIGLIDAADLSDAYANCARKAILGAVRGYGRGDALFNGFPSDTTWRRVLVEPRDFHRLKCISNDAQWRRLTDGTRQIQETACKIAADQDIADVDRAVASIVRAMVQELEQGSPTPELILVELDDALVIVEGHKRATAYAILNRPFAAFVGTSPAMGGWRYGRD